MGLLKRIDQIKRDFFETIIDMDEDKGPDYHLQT